MGESARRRDEGTACEASEVVRTATPAGLRPSPAPIARSVPLIAIAKRRPQSAFGGDYCPRALSHGAPSSRREMPRHGHSCCQPAPFPRRRRRGSRPRRVGPGSHRLREPRIDGSGDGRCRDAGRARGGGTSAGRPHTPARARVTAEPMSGRGQRSLQMIVRAPGTHSAFDGALTTAREPVTPWAAAPRRTSSHRRS